MDITKKLQSIGDTIMMRRKELNMDRKDLAVNVDVSLDTIGSYERGEPSMKLLTLINISQALDLDLGILVSDSRSAMLWKYEQLNDSHKKFVKEMIDLCYSDERHSLPR